MALGLVASLIAYGMKPEDMGSRIQHALLGAVFDNVLLGFLLKASEPSKWRPSG